MKHKINILIILFMAVIVINLNCNFFNKDDTETHDHDQEEKQDVSFEHICLYRGPVNLVVIQGMNRFQSKYLR